MTTSYTAPEDYDRIPEDDQIQEAGVFRQTHRSVLDMLPFLMSGDSDDPDPDFDDGFLY